MTYTDVSVPLFRAAADFYFFAAALHAYGFSDAGRPFDDDQTFRCPVHLLCGSVEKGKKQRWESQA